MEGHEEGQVSSSDVCMGLYKGALYMVDEALIERIENPLVRAFLGEHLDKFAGDALFFSEKILAHVPPEGKFFVKGSGLAFFSAPIVNFMPDLPWQTIKTAIASGIFEIFNGKICDHGHPENQTSGAFEKDHSEVGLVKRAIVAAFASVCDSAEDAMGTILIGGVADLLGKYIALCIAGILNELAEHKSWPIVQIPLTTLTQTQSTD